MHSNYSHWVSIFNLCFDFGYKVGGERTHQPAMSQFQITELMRRGVSQPPSMAAFLESNGLYPRFLSISSPVPDSHRLSVSSLPSTLHISAWFSLSPFQTSTKIGMIVRVFVMGGPKKLWSQKFTPSKLSIEKSSFLENETRTIYHI